MQQKLPTGKPIHFKKVSNGKFKSEVVGDIHGWSMECIDWINYMQFNPNLVRSDGTYTPIFTAMDGEIELTIGTKKMKVDGYCETNEGKMIYEYLGCRYSTI